MNKGTCYIVGSYTPLTDHYGYAGIIIFQNKKYIVKGSMNNGLFIKMQSVGAEVHGVMETIKKCHELKINEIDLYSYSSFIKCLLNGACQTIKPGLIKFLDYIQSIQDEIKINFIKANKKDNIYEMEEARLICRNLLGI